jgi:hypothetical protein
VSDEEPPGLDPDAAIRGRSPGLDPDAAIGERTGEPPPRRFEPVIDTRRYQRMIGGFGLALVAAFSVYLFVRGGGNGTPGIAAGRRLHTFVAPLATSNLTADANAHPVCNPARPAVRGLNVCDREPIVVAFFALGAKPCVQQVNSLQRDAKRFPGIQFAAVAVGASHAAAAKAVAQHHWTIPIAYDESGILGQVYGVEICPLVEVARRGGTVAQRLIGKGWISAQNLAGAVARAKLEG